MYKRSKETTALHHANFLDFKEATKILLSAV